MFDPAPLLPPDPEVTVATRQLLVELDRGDAQAARELVARYEPGLRGHAAGHPWMPAVAVLMSVEDVVQEVFSRALASGLFATREDRRPGALERALHVVLDRVLADQLRAIGALKRGGGQVPQSLSEAPENTGSPLLSLLASSSTTPSVSARSAELLRLCQANLDDREWDVWRLRAVAGLDFEEIGDLAGTTAAAARGVMHRARKKLILALADLDPDGAE